MPTEPPGPRASKNTAYPEAQTLDATPRAFENTAYPEAQTQTLEATPRAPRLAAGAVLFDRAAEAPSVLLVKRANPPRQGSWSLPGGRVEWGERLAAALRREIAEETGLDVRVGPLIEVVELIDDEAHHHYVVLDYLCEVEGGALRAGDDAAEAAFVPVDELPGRGVTDAVREVVARALEMLSSR